MDALRAFKGKTLCKNSSLASAKNSTNLAKTPLNAPCNVNFKTPLSQSEIYVKLNKNLRADELEKACEFLLDDGLKQFCIAFEEILSAV